MRHIFHESRRRIRHTNLSHRSDLHGRRKTGHTQTLFPMLDLVSLPGHDRLQIFGKIPFRTLPSNQKHYGRWTDDRMYGLRRIPA